jgi:hypothetical protein
MRIHSSAVVAIAAKLFLGAAILISQQAAARPDGVIIGRVADADSGTPLSGVLVTASAGNSRHGAVVTDQQGNFVFRQLPAGSYTILARVGGNGYSPGGFLVTGQGHQIGAYLNGGYGQRRPNGATQAIDLAPGERFDRAVVRLWRGGAISGRILDEAGEALVGIVVSAVEHTSDGQLLTGPTTKTDDRGQYRLGTLTPGRYVVVVPQTQVLLPGTVLQADERAPGFRPQPPGVMFGDSRMIAPPPITTTNSVVAVGANARHFAYQTTFHPATPRLPDARVVLVRSGEDRSGIDVHLHPVPVTEVSGVLMGPDGPASGFNISIAPEDPSSGVTLIELAQTTTDANGRFHFPQTPAGSYSVRARANAAATSELFGTESVTVSGEAVRDVVVTLRPTATMNVRMVFEGSGERPSATRQKDVSLRLRRVTPLSRTSSGDHTTRGVADGKGMIAGILPGEYVLAVTDVDAWSLQSVIVAQRDATDLPMAIAAGAVLDVAVTLTDTPASIAGRVQGSAERATVLIFPADAERWGSARVSSRVFRSVRPASDGSFTIPGVVPGEYLAIAVDDAAVGDWLEVSVLQELAPRAATVLVHPGQAHSAVLPFVDLR